MRSNWRERWPIVNDKLGLWKVVTALLTALVMFLSGWVWNMEKRVTTLEVTRPYIVESVNEIKSDIKDIKAFIMKDGHP